MPRALLEFVSKQEIIKVVKSDIEPLLIDTKIANALKVAKSNFTDATKRTLI